jgi:hypothetical protein
MLPPRRAAGGGGGGGGSGYELTRQPGSYFFGKNPKIVRNSIFVARHFCIYCELVFFQKPSKRQK